MDCQEVRNRFSSLWEKELMPFEENLVKEHLARCPECRKELKGFEKTMEWLHAAGEVEVPAGFFPELQKRMQGRKGASPAEKVRASESRYSPAWKLPVQATAMVAVVFLVLYLTRMMPSEMSSLKESGQTSSSRFVEKKPEQSLVQDKTEPERVIPEKSPEAPPVNEMEQPAVPLRKDGRDAREGAKMKADVNRRESAAHPAAEPEKTAGAALPSPGSEKIEERVAEKEMPAMAAAFKAPQEIILKISDPEKMIGKVQELVKQSGGEIVSAEGNILLASLPASRYPEFKKEVTALGSSKEADPIKNIMPPKKDEAVLGKSKEPETPAISQENRMMIRILLIKE